MSAPRLSLKTSIDSPSASFYKLGIYSNADYLNNAFSIIGYALSDSSSHNPKHFAVLMTVNESGDAQAGSEKEIRKSQ